MRIVNSDIVNASCFNIMDGKDLNGGPIPVTDLKFSSTNNDATNSNGLLSPPTTPPTATPSENDYHPTQSNSGRFKFYKDGKIILELLHQKNGERMFWIPVSKSSTCWPPVGHCTPRQESSTSLSVSDDNSSIQSSPWQRDYCWKQAVPRKNISRELEFMMHILRPRRTKFPAAVVRRRRRRPYDAIIKQDVAVTTKRDTNISSTAVATDDTNRTQPLPCERDQIIHSGVGTRQRLNDVLQKLVERQSSRECSLAIGACRTDPGIVSPRKRILKEMEKVSLEEMGNANKKHRPRIAFGNGAGSSTATPCTTISMAAVGGNTTIAAISTFSSPSTTGGSAITAFAPTMTAVLATSSTMTKSTNSHSISSILSRDDEQSSFLRNLLKSPSDMCPIGGDASAAGANAVAELASASPPVAVSIDIHDAHVTHPALCSTPMASLLSPPPALTMPSSPSSALSYPSASKSLPQQLPPPTLHPLPPIPTYIPSPYLYHSASQPFLATPPVSNHPPYYPAFAAAADFRDSSAAWPVPSVSSLGRPSVYPSTSLMSPYPVLNPSPWVPVAHSSLQNYLVAENGTDVPLNLSKH